jgi:AsmA protein
MQKLIKWVAILVGAFVGLAVLLSIAIYLLVDIEEYRDDIAAAVSDATGRTLTIDGELSLSTFPCCGIRIGKVALSNAPGFEDEHFARAQLASVSVRVLPLLLRQELSIDELEVDGLDLQLVALRDGTTNWSFGDAAGGGEGATAGAGLNELNIGGISVSNSRLVYRDEAGGTDIEIAGLNFESGPINGADPFDLTARFGALGLVDNVAADIEASARARIDLEQLIANLDGFRIAATLDGRDLPAGQIAFNGSVDTVAGLGGEAIEFTGLDAEVELANVLAQLTGSGGYSADGIALSGSVKVPAFVPRELLAALGEEPLATADPDVLDALSLAGQINVAGDSAKLTGLDMRFDDSTMSGSAELASIEREAIRFDLTIDQLDLDRYLAPESETDEDQNAEADDSADEELLPVDMLRNLDLDGTLAVGALTVAGVQLSDANIRAKAGDGRIRLRPLTANLYGGKYSGDMRLNVQGYVPRLAVEENINDVAIGDFLSDFLDAESSLVGKGSLRFVGKGNGRTASKLIDTLTGTLVVNLDEGKYLGMDVWYEVRNVYAGLKGRSRPAVPATPLTVIESMQATAAVKRGMQIENDTLSVGIPFMNVTGSGLIDLNNFKLDYTLVGQVTEKPVFDDGTELDNLKGLTLGLGLSGDIAAPDVKVDLSALAASAAQKALQKETDKQLNRLLEKLGGSSGTDEPAGEEPATESDAADEEPDAKDVLRDSLKDLLRR